MNILPHLHHLEPLHSACIPRNTSFFFSQPCLGTKKIRCPKQLCTHKLNISLRPEIFVALEHSCWSQKTYYINWFSTVPFLQRRKGYIVYIRDGVPIMNVPLVATVTKRKMTRDKYWHGQEEEGILVYYWCYSHHGKQYGSSSKEKKTTIWFSNSTSEFIPTGKKSWSQRDICTLCSLQHYSQ